ncbi:MAG: hypothetical protein ACT443_13705 [Gemmatimonadota bacterium]
MAVANTGGALRSRLDLSAAIWAGIIAGAAFMMLEMLLVQFAMGESMWGPPRMIAALVMGKGVLPPPATFDIGILMVAMVVHFMLSIIYAIVLGFIVDRMGLGAAIMIGAVYGLILYLVNFYGMTVVFPWFAMARSWVGIFSHIMFGAIAAGAYKGLQRKSFVVGGSAGAQPHVGTR